MGNPWKLLDDSIDCCSSFGCEVSSYRAFDWLLEGLSASMNKLLTRAIVKVLITVTETNKLAWHFI